MAESTAHLESEIEGARQALDSNVEELGRRMHTVTDWRYHFSRHPMTWMGVAMVGGVLVGLRSRGYRPAGFDSGASGPRRIRSDFERTLITAFEDATAALLGVGATRLQEALARAVPGFRDELHRRTEARYARSGH
jgi:hypothetical protein